MASYLGCQNSHYHPLLGVGSLVSYPLSGDEHAKLERKEDRLLFYGCSTAMCRGHSHAPAHERDCAARYFVLIGVRRRCVENRAQVRHAPPKHPKTLKINNSKTPNFKLSYRFFFFPARFHRVHAGLILSAVRGAGPAQRGEGPTAPVRGPPVYGLRHYFIVSPCVSTSAIRVLLSPI